MSLGLRVSFGDQPYRGAILFNGEDKAPVSAKNTLHRHALLFGGAWATCRHLSSILHPIHDLGPANWTLEADAINLVNFVTDALFHEFEYTPLISLELLIVPPR